MSRFIGRAAASVLRQSHGLDTVQKFCLLKGRSSVSKAGPYVGSIQQRMLSSSSTPHGKTEGHGHDEHSAHGHDAHTPAHSSAPNPDIPELVAWKKQSWGEWLFDDGWRRPLKVEEGGTMRSDWRSFDFHPTNEHQDWIWAHTFAFVAITCMAFGWLWFFIYHLDGMEYRNWARREAYLELARREKYGLPWIDPNYYPPDVVLSHCPTDEELGDYPIVI